VGDYNLDVYIDGSLAFDLVPYGKRSDVGDAFPDYPDSDTGGFSMAFNYKSLSPGEHEIRVRAYDNVGNYNDAVTTFSTERFETDYVADDAEVSFSSLKNISLLDGRTLLFERADIEGRFWDFKVSWDRASQGLVITDIVDMGESYGNGGWALSAGAGSGGAGSGGAGSGGAGSGGGEDSDGAGSGGADSGSESGGGGIGAAPDYARVVATCSTYVTYFDGFVEFENGATQEEVIPGLEWAEEDPAFFVEFADGLMFLVQYDPVLLTKVDRESGWTAFLQIHRGAPPASCAYREPQSARPLVPDYDVGSIIEYGPYEFVSVSAAGDLETTLFSDRACPTWDTGDQLLIPDAWEYYDVKNVWPVLNLTRLRYEDGQPWCLE
jgi:hypothetical protein